MFEGIFCNLAKNMKTKKKDNHRVHTIIGVLTLNENCFFRKKKQQHFELEIFSSKSTFETKSITQKHEL
jgi:hypothetical protein